TQKGTRQSIGGLQGHWPNRRLVGIGNRTIQQLDPTWAGSTLSVVASGTTPAPVPVALAGALGAAAAVSVALKDSDQKIEALQMAAAEMSKEMMKVKKEKEEMKE
ncbi:MAG: hypothetical protein ACK55Z_14025, partial [bacterium]